MNASSAAQAEKVFGAPHAGQYHLGPVDFAESAWHNACAPAAGYRAELREPTGLGAEWLAGVAGEFADGGAVCDACISIETAQGRSIVARVVTYGTEQNPNDIDVSPSVFEAIHAGEYPRSMTWHFARCPDMGPLRIEYQAASNPYWTSLWIRNPRVPVTRVEVRSASHPSYVELRRSSDGTLTDDGGFGSGGFQLRITGLDGQSLTQEFSSFSAGALVTSQLQFE
jgi:expansin (peptidoglycan-binding protein)